MPVLNILSNGKFTTAPLAGDDLQIICLVLGAWRFIQLILVVPLGIDAIKRNIQGHNLLINGYPDWCPQYDTSYNHWVITGEAPELRRMQFTEIFVAIASFYTLFDFAWLLAVWSIACSVGTPTDPKGRDEKLRGLLILRIFAGNLIPLGLVIYALVYVTLRRSNNFGCGEMEPHRNPDSNTYFVMYSVLGVLYWIELSFLPAIVVQKVMRQIKNNRLTSNVYYSEEAKRRRLEQCLGSLFSCLNCVCGGKKWGGDLRNQGEMKDFANAAIEWTNNDADVGLCLSDLYVGMKLLKRVQAEERLNKIEDFDISRDAMVKSMAIPSKEPHEEAVDLHEIAHYAIYAKYAYYFQALAIEHLGVDHSALFYAPSEGPVALAGVNPELENVHLVYAQFQNGLASTPYGIVLNEMKKTVVIYVRGTDSLEDAVIDLQITPSPLDRAGEVCGFDGKNHCCHKGVLHRCKWVYNDLKQRKILKKLYAESSIYKDWQLILCGHSLGGSCAQLLSLMLRPSFPTLHCYAYCPPSIFDESLASHADEWVTTVICNCDIVPRLTPQNADNVRNDFFDTLSRIKVPKISAWRDVRTPCRKSHLVMRNKAILCAKEEINTQTAFYQEVEKLKKIRAEKNAANVKLFVAGKIVYLVENEGRYVPRYASRYEFDKVILSAKMLSDHSIDSLAPLLRKLDQNLEDENEVEADLNDSVLEEGDDEVEERNFFICCSTPNGKGTLVAFVIAMLSWILTVLSFQNCAFVERTYHEHENDSGTLSVNLGLLTYKPKRCINYDSCNITDHDDLVVLQFCNPYPTNYQPGPHLRHARIFSGMAAICGFVSIGLLFVSTAIRFRKCLRVLTLMMLLVACLFQGLQLTFLESNLCHGKVSLTIGSRTFYGEECFLDKGAYQSIFAIICWFIAAATASISFCSK